MKHLMLLVALFATCSLFARSASNAAKRTLNKPILKAGFHSDSKDRVQKLFALTPSYAHYMKRSGSTFTKVFSMPKKGSWQFLTNHAGLVDMNSDGMAEFFYAVKDLKKNRHIIVAYNPVKNSVYKMTRYANGRLKKSPNLKKNSSIHRWLVSRASILMRPVVVAPVHTTSAPMLSRPGLKYKCSVKTDGRGGRNQKRVGGTYCAINRADLQPNDMLVFQRANGHVKYVAIHERFSNGTWKTAYKGMMKTMRVSDVLKNRRATHLNISINGSHEVYEAVVGEVRVYVQTPQVRPQPTAGIIRDRNFEYICEVSTDGRGGQKRIGGNYCGISVSKLASNKQLYFQRVSGEVRYVTVHERFANGTWKITYKGALKPLRMDQIRKSTRSTHINISINGSHERYERVVGKARVYLKTDARPAVIAVSPMDAADNWVKSNGYLNRNQREKQINTYRYQGNQHFMGRVAGMHPVVATLKVGDITYKSYYKGLVSAYNHRTQRSYVVFVPKNKRNFVTALYSSGRHLFMGLQNSGIVRFDRRGFTMTHIYNKKLRNKDIWNIKKSGNRYHITVDDAVLKFNKATLER